MIVYSGTIGVAGESNWKNITNKQMQQHTLLYAQGKNKSRCVRNKQLGVGSK